MERIFSGIFSARSPLRFRSDDLALRSHALAMTSRLARVWLAAGPACLEAREELWEVIRRVGGATRRQSNDTMTTQVVNVASAAAAAAAEAERCGFPPLQFKTLDAPLDVVSLSSFRLITAEVVR